MGLLIALPVMAAVALPLAMAVAWVQKSHHRPGIYMILGTVAAILIFF